MICQILVVWHFGIFSIFSHIFIFNSDKLHSLDVDTHTFKYSHKKIFRIERSSDHHSHIKSVLHKVRWKLKVRRRTANVLPAA